MTSELLNVEVHLTVDTHCGIEWLLTLPLFFFFVFHQRKDLVILMISSYIPYHHTSSILVRGMNGVRNGAISTVFKRLRRVTVGCVVSDFHQHIGTLICVCIYYLNQPRILAVVYASI